MPTEEYVILGSGGHAMVVLDACQCAYPDANLEVRDDDPAKANAILLGVAIRTPIAPALGRRCHAAVGDNAVRRRLGEAVLQAGGILAPVVHPAALVSRHAAIESGAFIAAAAVVAPQARIGRGAIVNHGAVVDHDCEVGAWTHIAPGAVLGGAASVGEGCLIGSGAVLMPGVRVAVGATIGSGAVVTRDVAAGAVVTGVPGRVK